ncbi:MAG: tripartite tricarboxylate transporter TctB family protein [Granulosicoccus sp.]
MSISADRISGTFFLLLGLAMYFLVNPRYIESVSAGNIQPSTVPDILSVVIATCGALLVFKPTAQSINDPSNMLRAGIHGAVLAAGIYAMMWFGFEFVAPFMALAIMLLIGERRALWLIAGSLGMPALIWFLVIHALGRSLP